MTANLSRYLLTPLFDTGMNWKAKQREKQKRAERNALLSFNSLRPKLIDTKHRISGRKPNYSANQKAARDQYNKSNGKNGRLRNQKAYYSDMNGTGTGSIF